MNLFKHQDSSSLVIISLIFMTCMRYESTDIVRRNLMLITIGLRDSVR